MRDGHCNHQGGHLEEGGKKDANVLLLRIPEYNEVLEFYYIVKKNFRVDVDLETVFKSEERMVMPVTIPPPVDDARASLENIVPKFFKVDALDFLRRKLSSFGWREFHNG